MDGKITREYYRIIAQDGVVYTTDSYNNDLYWTAYLTAGQRKTTVKIQRVSVVSYVSDGNLYDMLNGSNAGDAVERGFVTGERVITAPHFADDVELSRYNPVNGWFVPETLGSIEGLTIAE